MPILHSRRDFLRSAAILAIGGDSLSRLIIAPPAFTLRIAIINGSDTDRINGAILGIDEARHAAALFGGEVVLDRVSWTSAIDRASAIIGDGDSVRGRTYVGAHRSGGPLLMNVTISDDDLRGVACSPRAFHVAPSAAMRRDAARQSGEVVAWDSSLERFGADTLNQRYEARFKTPMNGQAWSAWLAVKVLWESALRVKSGEPSKIAEYLTRDTTQFDGHKGRPLSFRAWDHQLRQPLYVRTGESVIEVPVGSGDEPTRATLDRLGTSASTTTCRLVP